MEVGVFRNLLYIFFYFYVDGKCISVFDFKEFFLFFFDGVFILRKFFFLELNISEIEMCIEIKCLYFRKFFYFFVF